MALTVQDGRGGSGTATTTISVSSFTPPSYPEGIVSYWKFEETSGTLALDSTDGNNGTLVGGPNRASGIVGNALDLDGSDDYVLLPDSANLSPVDAITLEAWVKPRDVTTDQHIISTGGGGPSPFGHDYYIRIEQGALEFRINDTPLRTTGVLPNVWSHVAATYDRLAAVRKVYVNGVLVGQNSYSAPINTGHTYVSIGINGRKLAGEPYTFMPLNGFVDEVAIYNKALSASEILRHYNNGLAGKGYELSSPSSSLVAHWSFDGNANDASGNGHDGTVNGATLTTDRFGNPDSAYRFDGVDDSISTTYGGILGSSPRTISMWLRRKLPDTRNMYALAYGGHAIGRGTTFRSGFNFAGTLGVDIDVSNGDILYSSAVDTSWHHYTWVVPDIADPKLTDVRIYEDGTPRSQVLIYAYDQAWCEQTSINTQPLYNVLIGDFWDDEHNSHFYFAGDIDDVRMYDRALSDEEIRALVN